MTTAADWQPKISCVMGIGGRCTIAAEALSCFLAQDFQDAELVVLNQNEAPVRFDHPRVRVVQEREGLDVLVAIRRRMLELARSDWVAYWDHDDLYLPWHLSTLYAERGDFPACKPASVWTSQNNRELRLWPGLFEGSWLFDRRVVLGPWPAIPEYLELPGICAMYLARHVTGRPRVRELDLGYHASYVYRWATGTEHHSGMASLADPDRVRRWRQLPAATDNENPLRVVDLAPRWREIVNQARILFGPDAALELRSRLGL